MLKGSADKEVRDRLIKTRFHRGFPTQEYKVSLQTNGTFWYKICKVG
jgi:hypothetical protein